MSKCEGCGVNLQNINPNDLGYVVSLDKSLCERCFRIRNYNEYKTVSKSNEDYINILESINKTDDLVILTVDLFNIKDIDTIFKYINKKVLLVLTKRDVLPKSCYDENFIKYFSKYNVLDTIVVSSTKNYNIDLLYSKINEYKTTNNVIVVGFTNSGKSTLINKLIYNYSDSNTYITTSSLPSTTIDTLSIKLNDELTLIDTPGLLSNGDIINYIDGNTIKRVIPNKKINPITYQVKTTETIYIDTFARLILSDNNMTIYCSNSLNINRVYKEDIDDRLICHIIDIEPNQDIVIEGLCFIKFTKKEQIKLYVLKDVNVYKRDSLI